MSNEPRENTDVELWRERDDYYADSIFVTKTGGIGINVNGTVIVLPVRDWFKLAYYESQRLAALRDSSLPEPDPDNIPGHL